MTAPANPQALLLRHQRDCKVCRHAKLEEVEQDFISWHAPGQIAKRYSIPERAIFRHAHALALFTRRNRNVKAALGVIIEKVHRVKITGPTIVAAICALSKINNSGQWIDRTESVSLNSLFEKMSARELERYARDGSLPPWFEQAVSGSQLRSAENPED
jgi:hypothetical protein